MKTHHSIRKLTLWVSLLIAVGTCTSTRSEDSTTGSPSLEETITWLNKHITSEGHSWEKNAESYDYWHQEETLVAFQVDDGWLSLGILKREIKDRNTPRSSGDWTTHYNSMRYCVYRVPLKDIYLGGRISNLSDTYAKYPVTGFTIASEMGMTLSFGTKEGAVKVSEFQLYDEWQHFREPSPSTINYYGINGKEASRDAYSSAEDAYHKWSNTTGKGRFDVPEGLEWKSQTLGGVLTIPVWTQEDTERLKKAMNHLITLSGGREAPKEPF